MIRMDVGLQVMRPRGCWIGFTTLSFRKLDLKDNLSIIYQAGEFHRCFLNNLIVFLRLASCLLERLSFYPQKGFPLAVNEFNRGSRQL